MARDGERDVRVPDTHKDRIHVRARATKPFKGYRVGRDVDLAKLVGVIEGTDEVARGAIVVCGARGIGRSSLVTARISGWDLEYAVASTLR